MSHTTDMSDTVMIFAAGLGTRMGALTRDRPKPLIPVAGRALIDHALDLVVAAGLRRAVINTHYMADLLAAHLVHETRLTIALSPEPEACLETGGGLRHAEVLLGAGPVWTLNADALWRGADPFATLAAHGPPPPGGARLLTVPRGHAIGHPGAGDFRLAPDGRLARRGAAAQAPLVFTGLQLIDPARAYGWPEPIFSLNPVWNAMLADGQLRGAEYDGQWCDVGQPDSIKLAEAMLRDG